MSDDKYISEHEKILEKKARYFFNNKQAVHITLKRKGDWENGFIISEPGVDFFILTYADEGKRKHGRDTNVYFYLELKDIVAKMEEK